MASGISAGALMTGCAGMAQAPLHSALIPRKAKPSSPATGDWVASTCQGCTQWCAVQIYVQGGRATRVRGNPLSKTNHGYCCPRGHLIPQQMYDPDRIKVPIKRTNPAKGPRHRSEVRAHHLGRSAQHRGRQDDGTAQGR
jgi:anaerobic selenocysteine-containing dehydrogenase